MNNSLTYRDYVGTVNFSAEDNTLYGKIIGISDLITFEGASVREVTKAFKEAVDDYIATCQQVGKHPLKTFKGSFNVRVSAELHRKAAIVAEKNNISLNDLVKQSLCFAVNNEKQIEEIISK